MATETTPDLRPDVGSPRAIARGRPFPLRVPIYAYVGLVVNLLAWYSSWARVGPWPYTFFFLWTGFILFLDGLNVARTGTSPLRRSLKRFVLLFVYSAPFWWTFEALNVPVQNWHYRLDHAYALIPYVAITTLDFATVLPAVMEMAELLASFRGLRPRLAPSDVGPRLPLAAASVLIAAGVAMVGIPWLFPTRTYGLVWACLVFLLDPINNLARRKSAAGHLLAGDWRFFVTLPLAALCCGFFWEMWNSRALPNWYYTVPGFDSAPHLFAMPLPGYSGYLPFGVELFAMYQFVLLVLRRRRDNLVI
jgi:hypothetical protein